MFRAILFTQWKWSRWILGVMVLACFAVPVASVQQARLGFAARADRFATESTLGTLEALSVLYPILVAIIASVVALTAWQADEKGRHVYALSLPLPRWHYVLLRLGAGGVLLIAPIVAVAAGALVASAAATIPPGLQAQPLALTIRFALALGVAYSLLFALAAGGERLGRPILAVLGSLVILHLVLALFQAGDLIRLVGEALLYWPGPFDIFGGRWMLIDV